MAEVIELAAHRNKQGDAQRTGGLTRTPELAFVLAIVKALPADTRERVLATVAELGRAFPDCEAAQEAREIAGRLGSVR